MTVEWTAEERRAWEAVGEAAAQVMALAEEHAMERAEMAHAFHQIQRALMARPTRRLLAARGGVVYVSPALEREESE